MAEVTTAELQQAVDEMVALKPLPEGYAMEIDESTHNILVVGPTLGFCVTNLAVKEGYYKVEYVPALEALIALEDKNNAAI